MMPKLLNSEGRRYQHSLKCPPDPRSSLLTSIPLQPIVQSNPCLKSCLREWFLSWANRSFTPAIEFKEKGKKGKAVHFAEIDGPASDRLADKRSAARDDKSTKALEKRGEQGYVTLDDVKYVALLLLQETEMQRICSFTTFMKNKNLDNFLMALLYYLSYFLEKISLERKPKSYMVALVEKKEMKLVLSKLDIAQKYLAQKYCILVLGLAMPDKHHMCCGKEKISDTQKDWKFFESFYTFCAYIAWIVFRRQHLTDIEEEIGRLFRSNMFNIPRRKREDEESGGEKKRMTFVQFRRMMAKRPAIKKAINMRSPVLSTLLPSPREKAQNIFEKKFHHGSIKLQAKIQKHLESLDTVAMPVVGILGEPRCLFNPHTLQPLELEETAKTPGRHFSVVERSNTRVRGTLDFALRTLSSQVTL
ncbi:protein phosphatase 1 regulatory subunit 36 isoform X3 [Elephas maximus indicus]|uniref:protein phosphatase 1 regulatory subunit 36 isoform X3 n=1 Tax=Elephas maximus indicus TaxID=99487 RepID=UPI002116E509|nr:protein phosphatase 1 regulatory subunit 36 isoform X3 [Elephas maximus indicus]XP_049754191.1 protein phosphatase 1 regulatory subunit 36 isoform X3 [Elephas maximus indicus]